MNLNEYQNSAAKFRVQTSTPLERLFGLGEEVGEVFGLLKRYERGDYAANIGEFGAKLHKELGDVLWYLSQVALDNHWELEDIAKTNLDKLESRSIRGVILGAGDNR